MNIEKLISKIPEGNTDAVETLKITYPNEFREYECKQWFKNDILNNLVKKIDEKEFTNWVFYFIGNKFFLDFKFDRDGKNVWFGVRYDECWEVFFDKFHYLYSETVEHIKDVVEEHFKMKVARPTISYSISTVKVEQHFKNK